MADRATAVRNIIDQFAAAWNLHDMKLLAGLFTHDAEFVNVVGLWWHGRPEIQAAHEFAHRTIFANSTLAIDETSIRFPASTFAIARSRWTLTGHVSPDGETLPVRHGVLVLTLVGNGNDWQVIDAQNTDVVENEITVPQ